MVSVIGRSDVEFVFFMVSAGSFVVVSMNHAGYLVLLVSLFFACWEPKEGPVLISYSGGVRFMFQGFVINGALIPHSSAFMFVLLRR